MRKVWISAVWVLVYWCPRPVQVPRAVRSRSTNSCDSRWSGIATCWPRVSDWQKPRVSFVARECAPIPPSTLTTVVENRWDPLARLNWRFATRIPSSWAANAASVKPSGKVASRRPRLSMPHASGSLSST